VIVREAAPADAIPIACVYNYYVESSHCTFEVSAVNEIEMRRRIAESNDERLRFIVAEDAGLIVGFANCHPWRARAAYARTVEISVYVHPQETGKGAGSQLYRELFSGMRAADVHVAIAGISLPNDASVRLHEKFGMKKVAHFSQVGRKFDRWIDVGHWQVVLDR